MGTKFGYVERNLENDVNWAQVGKGFSDMLLAERDDREARKGVLDDAMQSTLDGFKNEAPIGYNTTFNDVVSDFGSNSTAFTLAANKDLKAGKITPQEYMRKLQRLNSGADTFFALGSDFNAIYEDKLNRMDEKTSGNVEQTAFEAMADLTSFNNHGITIDADGTVIAAPLVRGKDGVTTMDTSKARSVQAMFSLAQSKVNRLDVDGVVSEKVALLGETILGTDVAASYSKAGLKVVTKGMRFNQPEKYIEWKDGVIDGIMASPLDVASVLSDYRNKYETTADKKLWESDKNKYIYVNLENGKEVSVDLTEAQTADARKILDGVVDSQVGGSREETARSEVTPDTSTREAWEKKNATAAMKKNAITMLGHLYAGKTEADIQAAMTYFEGLNENIEEVRRTSTGISLTTRDKDGNTKAIEIPFKKGNDQISFDMFVKTATQLTKNVDVSDALSKIDRTNLAWDSNTKRYTLSDIETSKTRTFTKADSASDNFVKALKSNFNSKNTPAEYVTALEGAGVEAVATGDDNMIKVWGKGPYDITKPTDVNTILNLASRNLTAVQQESYIGGGTGKKKLPGT
jgi:hypothetical protein